MVREPLTLRRSSFDEVAADLDRVDASAEENVQSKESSGVRFADSCKSRNQALLANCNNRFKTTLLQRFRTVMYLYLWHLV
jgi:ElaB/YqjD/DUF883 family membrane-anchored ribosome-binding protein